jgi:hypothetical protein
VANYNLTKTLCKIQKQCSSGPLQPSERCGISSGRSTIKASSVQTTRTFRPDLPLCPEVSNCSKLHPSGRLSNTTGRLSMFDKEKVFILKHRYGKTAVTVRTLSLIRQVVHTKFNCSEVSLYGPDAQALIWKLRAAEVQPPGR